jgi:glycosyltransferase involved in cell wall biosynthesis
MRVLIDGCMARGGGGHTYLVNVIPRLVRSAPRDRFRLLVRSSKVVEALPALPNLEVDLLPPVGFLGRLRFVHGALPRLAGEWGADVFFSAGETAPIWAPCPKIAAFRNPNVFTQLDQGWSPKQSLRLTTLLALARVSAWTCDKIMFVSEDSARWIGERLGLPEPRRAVVHHGIDAEAWGAPASRSLHPWPYILSVSSIYRYKNFVKLIEAYTQLARGLNDVPDLVIIGDDQDPEYAAKMQAARAAAGDLAEHIHLLGEVPYADVRDWYAGAELFVFPSYLETFGHPLLEAMAARIPVVAADIPVFREIGGDAALYADPHDASSLAGAMRAALASPELRRLLIKRGLEQVRSFTWDGSALRLLQLFREVLPERVRVASPSKVAA